MTEANGAPIAIPRVLRENPWPIDPVYGNISTIHRLPYTLYPHSIKENRIMALSRSVLTAA